MGLDLEPVQSAGRLAAAADAEAGAETTSLTGFLHKLCRYTRHMLISSTTALAAVAAAMSSAAGQTQVHGQPHTGRRQRKTQTN